MKVLVTGAAGFIGRYVVDELLKKGYEVIALVHKDRLRVKKITQIEADICDENMIENIVSQINNCDIIIHLAAVIDMNGNDQTILANCLGTFHLIRLAALLSVTCFIYMSSIPVIGTPVRLPITEEHPAEPKTLYHITKYAGEQIVKMGDSEKMRTIVLRIPSPIGAGMNTNNYLSFLLRKCMANETIELYGQGERKQNYIDVRDIACAVLCAFSSEASGMFLIAGKKEISNRELAFLCRRITGSSSRIIWGKREDPEEKNQWVISVQKAVESFGFFPQYELEETIHWIVENVEGQLV